MNRNFHELKQQLAELSETINKFESEAVQLRIVELLFSETGNGSELSEGENGVYAAGPGRLMAGQGEMGGLPGRRRRAVPSASGAVAALAKLVDSDFFLKKRTIGDVVKKCEEEVGTRYRSNAFSGPLSRYARSGVLKREKNAEGKYVYFR